MAPVLSVTLILTYSYMKFVAMSKSFKWV